MERVEGRDVPPTQYWTLYKKLILHCQTRIMVEDKARFERLVVTFLTVSMKWLKGAFMASLSDRIQAKIRLL